MILYFTQATNLAVKHLLCLSLSQLSRNWISDKLFEIKIKKISRPGLRCHTRQNLVFSRCCVAEDGKECSNNYNARAQPLFCSLNLLFDYVPVAIVVFLKPRSNDRNISTQHIPTLLAQHLEAPAKRSRHLNATLLCATCCTRLATLLRRVGYWKSN